MPLIEEVTADMKENVTLFNKDGENGRAAPGLQSKLYTIITVWFFWGFVAASNGIFIPFCKTHFHLNQAQSQEIELAFYGAYFAGSLLLWLLSQLFGFDIITRFGYKKAIIYGLLVSVLGALSMVPAVNSGSFNFILMSFFIIAMGFCLQQIASQPYVMALGPSATGTHRINLAAAVNSLGTLLGPIVVSVILFGKLNVSPVNASISSINTMYLILAGIFIAAALFLGFSELPRITDSEKFERGAGALKHPQLVWGMIAIFCYVGAEVTIQSNMGSLLKKREFGGYNEAHISTFISLFWGSLMIGRMCGAVSAFNLSGKIKVFYKIFIPLAGFLLVIIVNVLKNNDYMDFLVYIPCVVLMITAMIFGQEKPFKTLLIFSILGVSAICIGLLSEGKIAVYAFISGGLWCSVLWPCIVPSALAGLGKYVNQGMTFIIMSVLGAALIPYLQGRLADRSSIGIHLSYIIPAICFAYLIFYALIVKRILKKKGLDFDTMQSSGH